MPADQDLTMNYNYNVQEEQWMALPLSNRDAAVDISRNVSTWPHPLPEPSLQWFMDPSSRSEVPETPVQWVMDASAFGHTIYPSTPWTMDSSSSKDLTGPSIPWVTEPLDLESSTSSSMPCIMDTSGLKCFPEPQIPGLLGPPILASPSEPLTPTCLHIPDVPMEPPSRDKPILSSPGSSSSHPSSPPELVFAHIAPGDFTSLSHSKCPVPGRSTARLTTAQGSQRHYRQHARSFFCHYENCPQSAPDPQSPSKRGFATRKDRDRHEAKHKPEIRCNWRNQQGEQCTRLFSRMDNMRDHVRRIHRRKF
ncbi:hypothetical protein ABOM_005892 [Aspergillus bombycis]|uniref:C2H2-type domain-containing protein n=1 Tax=Aspergillus bombycis TaxID=109264 RepID=A0A1F8A1C2_9EURO|nr:hypothetical protein ABOM_005892 [Aspergillus bombycis]OGM45229.1 hypothetical protein ABOM_005892 [Aspergillus bombycis]